MTKMSTNPPKFFKKSGQMFNNLKYLIKIIILASYILNSKQFKIALKNFLLSTRKKKRIKRCLQNDFQEIFKTKIDINEIISNYLEFELFEIFSRLFL